MRPLALLPLLLLAAACSDAGGEAEPAKAPADTTLAAGQWETTTEVTQLTKLDPGAPKIDTPAGTKASFTSCLPEADRKKPAAALFAGTADKCEYKDFYMARGRLNATLSCTRDGLQGNVLHSIDGSNDADSFEGERSTSTQLVTDGDVRIIAKISGRRVGECTAA